MHSIFFITFEIDIVAYEKQNTRLYPKSNLAGRIQNVQRGSQ